MPAISSKYPTLEWSRMRFVPGLIPTLLVATLFAGCTGPVEAPPSTDPPGANAWAPHVASLAKVTSWSKAVSIAKRNSAEPGLHVAGDGTIYLDVWNSLYVSTD